MEGRFLHCDRLSRKLPSSKHRTSEFAYRDLVSPPRAEVPCFGVRVTVGEQSRPELKIRLAKLQNMLPRSHGRRIAQNYWLTGNNRAHNIGNNAVGRPVPPSNHVTASCGGNLDYSNLLAQIFL